MSHANPSRRHDITIERLSRPTRTGESDPLLSKTVESVLVPLVDRAALDPEHWHTIPNYELAIRFIAPSAPSRSPAFEVRRASDVDSAYRYRYEHHTDTLTCWSHDELEHPNLSESSELPTDPEDLARLVTIVLRKRPETTVPSATAPTQATGAQYLAPPDFPPHGPISLAVAEILRHITTNWFGGRETAWSTPIRLLYAFLGSITFFAMQALVLLRFEVISSLFPPLDSAVFLTPLQIVLLIILPLAIIFAVISAYIDRQHGPVRLFLGGFLLPYLPWSLTVLVTWGLTK